MQIKKKAKMGRPKLPEKERLASWFSVRLTSDEASKVNTAIKRSDTAQADWLRQALLNAAKHQR